jgi:hypothetical protein
MKKVFMLMAAVAMTATVAALGNVESLHRHSMPEQSRLKRMCGIHRIWYDMRFGGCPMCRAPQFGL